MAIVYEKEIRGQAYSVRRAGASTRLYTNGVFHSQWNGRQPLAGHLWDNLFLPVLFSPSFDKAGLKTLVLGVGGGAVINALNTMTTCERIVGVDIDRHHLTLAKRYFLERRDNVSLVHQDAVAYTCGSSEKFHYIVEDLFCGNEEDHSDAIRPVSVTDEWLSALSSRLLTDGILAINFESKKHMLAALPQKTVERAGFSRKLYLSHPRYENAIAVLVKGSATKKYFAQNLEALKKRLGSTKFSRLTYTLHGRQ